MSMSRNIAYFDLSCVQAPLLVALCPHHSIKLYLVKLIRADKFQGDSIHQTLSAKFGSNLIFVFKIDLNIRRKWRNYSFTGNLCSTRIWQSNISGVSIIHSVFMYIVQNLHGEKQQWFLFIQEFEPILFRSVWSVKNFKGEKQIRFFRSWSYGCFLALLGRDCQTKPRIAMDTRYRWG